MCFGVVDFLKWLVEDDGEVVYLMFIFVDILVIVGNFFIFLGFLVFCKKS